MKCQEKFEKWKFLLMVWRFRKRKVGANIKPDIQMLSITVCSNY